MHSSCIEDYTLQYRLLHYFIPALKLIPFATSIFTSLIFFNHFGIYKQKANTFLSFPSESCSEGICINSVSD